MKLDKNLIRGSFILLIAFGLFNLFHFLFQLMMARKLSLSDYAILATLFSVTYILTIFTESIQIIITKYSAKEKENGKLKNIIIKASQRAIKASFILFLFYLIVAFPLSILLKISYLLLAINGLLIFFAFLIPINKGVMQGKERFFSLGGNMIIESSMKLFLGVVFVYLGWRVYGAIWGVIFGSLIAFAFSFLQLKDILKSKEEKAQISGIYNYARPTFFITAIIVIFYSLDVILAKIFFNPEIAGSYAIASILGKIIFWGTLPISKAMFPISAENSLHEEKSDNVFLNALGIVTFGIIVSLVIFYFFSHFIIKVFSGRLIPEAISILFYVGIAFSFISIANLLLLYKLSLGKIKGYSYLFVFVLLEIFLLSYFSNNLFQFSIAFITASATFLWGTIFLIREFNS